MESTSAARFEGGAGLSPPFASPSAVAEGDGVGAPPELQRGVEAAAEALTGLQDEPNPTPGQRALQGRPAPEEPEESPDRVSASPSSAVRGNEELC